MKIEDLYVCDNYTYIHSARIIIYGAGYWGKQVLNILKKIESNIIGVCTTTPDNEEIYGYSVISLDDVKKKYDKADVLLVISSLEFYKEMIQNCETRQFENLKICTFHALILSIILHYQEMRLPSAFREELKYNILASEERKESLGKLYAYDMMIRAAEEAGDKVLIYQPGKVGSQSIWNSIRTESLQFHSLVVPYAYQEFNSDILDYYINMIRKKNIKIITAVREPISRDLAAMFQNCDAEIWPFNAINANIFFSYGDFFEYRDKKLNLETSKKRAPLWKGTLNDSFNKLAMSIVEYKMDEFEWFNYEIRDIFGIDVYKEPFDKEKGYALIKKEKVEILILKVEKLNTLESVIGEFIGKRDYKLINQNLSDDKIYNYVYKELKEKIQICDYYFRYYYEGNSYLEHFYSDEEIEYYKRKWEKHVENINEN